MNRELIRRIVYAIASVSPQLGAEIAVRLFTTPQPIARPEWEKKLVAEGEGVPLESGLKAWAWGEVGCPQVLLVHGWQGRGTQLGALIAPLLERGYRIVALDGPGHGDSPGKRTSIKIFADEIVRTQKQLGEVTAVIAHSFGAGATALSLTRGLEVNRVVLVATPSDYQWVVDSFLQNMGFTKRMKDAFQYRLEKWVGIPESEINIGELGRRAGGKDEIPALIVHDPGDKEVPYYHAEIIVKEWKSARLLTINGVGHRRILKAPEFVRGVIEFLSERS